MADALGETIKLSSLLALYSDYFNSLSPMNRAKYREEVKSDLGKISDTENVIVEGRRVVDEEGRPVYGITYRQQVNNIVGKGKKGGSQASGVIQAIMANKEDYLSKLTQDQLNIVAEHFDVDKKVRRKDGDGKRKYVRKNHSALQIKEQVGNLQEINDFIKERFPDVRPKRPYNLDEDLKEDFPDGRNQLASKSVLEKGAEEGKDDYEENLRIYERLPAFFKNEKSRHSEGREITKDGFIKGFSNKYTMMNTNNQDRSLDDALPHIYEKSKAILKYLLKKGISITDYDGIVALPDAYSDFIYRDLDTINGILKWWDDPFLIPDTYEEFKEENEADPDEGFAGLYNGNKDFARAMDFAFALKKLYGLTDDDTFVSVMEKRPVIDAQDYLDWVERSGIVNKYYERDYIQGTEQITRGLSRRDPRLRWERERNGELRLTRDAFPFAPFEAKRKGKSLVFGNKIREPPGGLTDREKREIKNRRRRGMRGRGVPPEVAFWKGAKYSYDKVAPNVLGYGYVKIVDTPTFDAYLRRSDKSILLASRGTNITSWGDLKADAQLVANRLSKTNRYARDVEVLRSIVAKYPPEDGYEYYIAGHSLSVAIANQLMRDFPFIKKAVGYNGAFQPADLVQQNPDIKRLYTDKDFLYNLGGKMFRNVKVIPMTENKAQGFFGRIKSVLTPSGVKGHYLDNFKPLYGLGMKGRGAELVRRVADRKVGGSKKSGYIASLITCKNKPLSLKKFENQSEGFKKYTKKKLTKRKYPSCEVDDDTDQRWKAYLDSLPNRRAKATAQQRLRYYTAGVEGKDLNAYPRKDAIKLLLQKAGYEGGSQKSGYIASLITGKNKPMELSKFVKQSDAFKKYTLPQLIKDGKVKVKSKASKELANLLFDKEGRLKPRGDWGIAGMVGDFLGTDEKGSAKLYDILEKIKDTAEQTFYPWWLNSASQFGDIGIVEGLNNLDLYKDEEKIIERDYFLKNSVVEALKNNFSKRILENAYGERWEDEFYFDEEDYDPTYHIPDEFEVITDATDDDPIGVYFYTRRRTDKMKRVLKEITERKKEAFKLINEALKEIKRKPIKEPPFPKRSVEREVEDRGIPVGKSRAITLTDDDEIRQAIIGFNERFEDFADKIRTKRRGRPIKIWRTPKGKLKVEYQNK